jgi:hypothetical protein
LIGVKRASRANHAPPEATEQRVLAQYLDAMRLVWLHVANEGARSPLVGRRLREAGLRRGAPDVLIFSRLVEPFTHHRGLAIELKRRAGGHVTAEQREWLERLRACGWLAEVCRGADEAIALVQRTCIPGGIECRLTPSLHPPR